MSLANLQLNEGWSPPTDVDGNILLAFLPSAVLAGETRVLTFALVPQCFMTLRLRSALASWQGTRPK